MNCYVAKYSDIFGKYSGIKGKYCGILGKYGLFLENTIVLGVNSVVL